MSYVASSAAGVPGNHASRRMAIALGMAVALHASLLLIPGVRERLATPLESFSVSVFLQPPQARQPAEPPTREFVERPPVAPTLELPARPQPFEKAAAESAPDIVTAPARDPEAFRWTPPEASSTPHRQLGVYEPVPLPDNWTRPVLPVEPNRFDDAVLPSEIEIVDRWQDPDGTHNVVVNTPTGDTLCGRAQPYNPMERLVEPIMIFRSCAGGGERKLNFRRSSFNTR